MMVDLGKYAFAVLSSYAITVSLLVLIVSVSAMQWRKAKRDLEAIEKKSK